MFWLGFHKDIKNLIVILRKNLFPVHIEEKGINRYLSRATIRPSATVALRFSKPFQPIVLSYHM